MTAAACMAWMFVSTSITGGRGLFAFVDHRSSIRMSTRSMGKPFNSGKNGSELISQFVRETDGSLGDTKGGIRGCLVRLRVYVADSAVQRTIGRPLENLTKAAF
jgi:hypothetical protein